MKNLKLWSEEMKPTGRLIWVKIVGIPVHAWSPQIVHDSLRKVGKVMHELNQTLLISINDRNVWLKINEDHTRTIVEGPPYKDDTGSHHVNDDHANLVVDEVESDVGEFEPNSPPAVIAMAEDASKFDIPDGGSTTNQSPRHAKPAKGGANVPGPISDVGPTQVENNEQTTGDKFHRSLEKRKSNQSSHSCESLPIRVGGRLSFHKLKSKVNMKGASKKKIKLSKSKISFTCKKDGSNTTGSNEINSGMLSGDARDQWIKYALGIGLKPVDQDKEISKRRVPSS
ncbi:hypothetical protein Tco_0210591 [Tanacetum coccineum]